MKRHNVFRNAIEILEGCLDLQSSASPLRHEAIRTHKERVVTGV